MFCEFVVYGLWVAETMLGHDDISVRSSWASVDVVLLDAPPMDLLILHSALKSVQLLSVEVSKCTIITEIHYCYLPVSWICYCNTNYDTHVVVVF